jgi:hypothetical protein
MGWVMKTIINTIPGYRVYEYLLVLSPHEELWNKIVKVKNDFAEQYKSDHARWGKATFDIWQLLFNII